MILKGEGVTLDAPAAKMLLFKNVPIVNVDIAHVLSAMGGLLTPHLLRVTYEDMRLLLLVHCNSAWINKSIRCSN